MGRIRAGKLLFFEKKVPSVGANLLTLLNDEWREKFRMQWSTRSILQTVECGRLPTAIAYQRLLPINL